MKTVAKNEKVTLPFPTRDAAGEQITLTSAGTMAVLRMDDETGAITAATKADPCVITSAGHGRTNGEQLLLRGLGGMTQANSLIVTVANKTDDTFECTGVDSSAFGTYTSGGTWRKVAVITAGLTTTKDVDADGTGAVNLGAQHLEIDTSANASYVRNAEYQAWMLDGTVDAKTVTALIGEFEIGSAILCTIDDSAYTPDQGSFETDTTDAVTSTVGFWSSAAVRFHRGSSLANHPTAYVTFCKQASSNEKFQTTPLSAAPVDGDKFYLDPQ